MKSWSHPQISFEGDSYMWQTRLHSELISLCSARNNVIKELNLIAMAQAVVHSEGLLLKETIIYMNYIRVYAKSD